MGPTRPSSAVFGYPTMSMHGTLPPVPLPRLQAPPRPRQRHQPPPEPDSSDSELHQDKDRADLLPHNSGFHVPRPKSRSSVAVSYFALKDWKVKIIKDFLFSVFRTWVGFTTTWSTIRATLSICRKIISQCRRTAWRGRTTGLDCYFKSE